MPYGTPAQSGIPTYTVIAVHDNGANVLIQSMLLPGENEPDRDEAFQALVDLLDAAGDWSLNVRRKEIPFESEITPTP